MTTSPACKPSNEVAITPATIHRYASALLADVRSLIRASEPRGTWARVELAVADHRDQVAARRAERAQRRGQDGLCTPLVERIRRRTQSAVVAAARGFRAVGDSVSTIHSVTVALGAPGVRSTVQDDETRIGCMGAYRRRQWVGAPKSADHVMTVPQGWIARVERAGLADVAIPGHVVTLDAWAVPSDLVGGALVYRLVYAAATRGYALQAATCWYHPASGRHGDSLARLGLRVRRGAEQALRWYLDDEPVSWSRLDAVTTLVQRVGRGTEARLARVILRAGRDAVDTVRLRDLSARWRSLVALRRAMLAAGGCEGVRGDSPIMQAIAASVLGQALGQIPGHLARCERPIEVDGGPAGIAADPRASVGRILIGLADELPALVAWGGSGTLVGQVIAAESLCLERRVLRAIEQQRRCDEVAAERVRRHVHDVAAARDHAYDLDAAVRALGDRL